MGGRILLHGACVVRPLVEGTPILHLIEGVCAMSNILRSPAPGADNQGDVTICSLAWLSLVALQRQRMIMHGIFQQGTPPDCDRQAHDRAGGRCMGAPLIGSETIAGLAA